MIFFDFACPSFHPSIHPSIQVGDPPGTPEAGVTGHMGMPFSKIIFNDLSSELKSESNPKINFLFFSFYPVFHFPFFFLFCCSPYLFSFFLFVVLKSSHKRYTAFRFRIKYSTCKTREILYKKLKYCIFT